MSEKIEIPRHLRSFFEEHAERLRREQKKLGEKNPKITAELVYAFAMDKALQKIESMSYDEVLEIARKMGSRPCPECNFMMIPMQGGVLECPNEQCLVISVSHKGEIIRAAAL